jgi:DNA-binding response OmpR family regulator
MRGVSLLLVESKSAGSESLAPSLIKADLQVKIAYTGSEALFMISEGRPDLVVVDATNMRSNGVRTCRRLKKDLGDTPIIHCRNQNQNDDRTAGADVYLVQPFTARKLLNRVRVLIPADDLNEEIVRAGPLTLYTSKRSVEILGQGEKRLTPKLATLLNEFLLHPNEVIGRHHLMKVVWDTDYFGDTRTLDVHIRWLREIIEDNPAKPQLLRTVRGVGYIFSIPSVND